MAQPEAGHVTVWPASAMVMHLHYSACLVHQCVAYWKLFQKQHSVGTFSVQEIVQLFVFSYLLIYVPSVGLYAVHMTATIFLQGCLNWCLHYPQCNSAITDSGLCLLSLPDFKSKLKKSDPDFSLHCTLIFLIFLFVMCLKFTSLSFPKLYISDTVTV